VSGGGKKKNTKGPKDTKTQRFLNTAVKTAAAKSTRSACADPGKTVVVKRKTQHTAMGKRKTQRTQRTQRFLNTAVKTAAAKSKRSAYADPDPVGGEIRTFEIRQVGLRRPRVNGENKKR
jgi:hypothetical protein